MLLNSITVATMPEVMVLPLHAMADIRWLPQCVNRAGIILV